jgi:aminoglycoside/choline kinase family phosphotransferase
MRNPAAWRHPRLPAALKPAMAEAVLRLWDERTLLLDSIEQLPQTLCHLDFWPPNLFARGRDDGQEQTVLLDWSHVGLGAYAEDIANLALDSGWMFWVDHSALAEFEQLVWTG